jgi:undecaprenyl-diphosphatase
MAFDVIMIGVGLAGIVVAIAAGIAWGVQRLARAVVPVVRARVAPVLAWSGVPANRLPRAELPGLAVLGVLLIGSLWLLFGVMQDLIAGDPLVHADHAVLHLLVSLRVGWVTLLAVWVSALGSGVVVLALGIGVVLWLDRQRAWRAMAYVITAIIGAIVFAAGLDMALGRPAPFPGVAGGLNLLPFPGTHLAVLTALLGFVAVVIGRASGRPRRVAVVTVSLGLLGWFLGLLLAARLYLGADYLSTGLEAVAFGAAWALVLGLAYLARPAEAVRPVGLAMVVVLAIFCVGGIAGAVGQRAALRHARVSGGSFTMSRAEWLRGGWTRLPRRPLSLFGSFGGRFAVQYLGAPEVLRDDLAAHGWVVARRFAVGGLGRMDAVMPRFDDGALPRLVMLRRGGDLPADQRLVFRLWRSDVMVPSRAGGFDFVWLGSVTLERVRMVGGVLALARDVGRDRFARRDLFGAIGAPIDLVRPEGARVVRLAVDRAGGGSR